MRTKSNPAAIGAFVLGAIALMIGAVMLLGAGIFLRNPVELVAFFPGSVNGLSTGAPVKFKGVEIGRVTKILLAVDHADSTDFQIPVFFELDPEKLAQQNAVLGADDLRNKAVLKELYKIGLRARLESQSILTGILYVELDIYPGTPFKLQLDDDSKLREIPTLPTKIDEATTAITDILDKIEDLDIEKLVESLNEAISEVNQLIRSEELKSALKRVDQLLINADAAVVEVRELVQSTRNNVGQVSGSVTETLERARESLASIDATLDAASTTLDSVNGLVDDDSPVVFRLSQTLQSVDDAARAIRRLADAIERNPSSIVFGRPEDQEQGADE